MPITITLDNADMLNKAFMLATSRYFSELAGEPLQSKTVTERVGDTEHSVTINGSVDISGALKNDLYLKGVGVTAGDAGAIRDDENEQVGVDADRPNVPPAPDTADAETPSTTPAEPTDIFGKASVSQMDVVPIVPEVPAPLGDAIPTPPVSGADLDSNGLPWDVRIHASTKAKVADGSWRALRGVDKDFVTVVEQELRELMAIPSPNAQSVPEPETSGAQIPEPSNVDVNVPTPIATIDPVASTVSVPEFVQWMMALIKDGKITMAKCNEGIASTGAKGLPDLTVRKDLIPAAKLAIERML